jgi:Phospholipid methyltransferase
MYLAVTAVIVGQALALGQPALLLYATAVGAAMAAFAYGYEEPTLQRQFGAQYQAYRRAVPAWWPRRHPWQPGQPTSPPAMDRDHRPVSAGDRAVTQRPKDIDQEPSRRYP